MHVMASTPPLYRVARNGVDTNERGSATVHTARIHTGDDPITSGSVPQPILLPEASRYATVNMYMIDSGVKPA